MNGGLKGRVNWTRDPSVRKPSAYHRALAMTCFTSRRMTSPRLPIAVRSSARSGSLKNKEVTGELAEAEDGTVTAKWSDDVTCKLPGGKTISDARCTCPATELCRHVVRTVLAYQMRAPATPASGVNEPWNPGEITDEELAKHFKPATLTAARTQFQMGLLVELVKSHKPTVRFHDLACTLRFQVRGDPRYVHCDCASPPPCVHAALGIWAFRRLTSDKSAGIITTQRVHYAGSDTGSGTH